MNKYPSYTEDELYLLLNEPWEVSDRPYMLHAAFALCSLNDLMADDDNDDEQNNGNVIKWGSMVPQKLIDGLANDLAEDFNDAASQRKTLRIWGKNYSIRKVNAYDHNRLKNIFNFPLIDDEYKITKEGILNLGGQCTSGLKEYEVTKAEAAENRAYLRQIIKLAEDDDNNGWDKLTDMEVMVYCWALYYNKKQVNNLLEFESLYKDHIYVSHSDIVLCFNKKATLRQAPYGLYTFSAEKVKSWNSANQQKSYASLIPIEDAEDYWYNTALKKTFKPI